MSVLKFKNINGDWQEIAAIQGPQGEKGDPGADGKDFKFEDFTLPQLMALKGPQGEPGPKGDSYVLTEDDKAAIAAIVLAELPSSEEVGY